ncbi:MAG: S8 family serine peptidase [Chloroflexi bacterium]|nr:S8 family serine peptidase [Chloroflexota bacterium]
MSSLLPVGWPAVVATWLAFVLLAAGAPAAFAQQTAQVESVIVYKTRPSGEDLQRLDSAQVRYQVLKQLPIALVRGPAEQVRAAASGPNVRAVRSNAPLEYYLDQSVPAIGANRVWVDLGFTGRQVGVVVVDSGIDTRHDDLPMGSKVVQNVDLRVAPPDAPGTSGLLLVADNVADSDTSGHGTHVASTLAGTGSASEGRYVGVARNANLVGVGGGENLSTFSVLGAFDWVLDNQERLSLRVVNNSWGSVGAFDPDAPINIATRALHDAGITVVFAAGNGGPTQNTLNAFSVAPWVIGVAAAKNDRSLADFSSRGIKGDPLYHPAITAPGVQITAARDPSSFIGAIVSPRSTDSYMAMSGTSLAAPHVAGVVALMLEANDRLDPDEVKALLVRAADLIPGYDEYEVGAGFLNAFEAVRRARR